MTYKIEFDLIQNACESLRYAIDVLAYESSFDESQKYKRSIMSLYHAIELLLKERIRIIHPSLIWDNVDSYPDLNGRTVGSERALVRLKNIGGIKLTTKQEDIIRSLRRTRNAIEHYKWSISPQEASHIIGHSLAFAIMFAKVHLNIEIFSIRDVKDGLISDLVINNSGFKEAFEFMKEEFDKVADSDLATCVFCKASVKFEDNSCPICGHWQGRKYDESFYDDEPF